MLGLPNPWLLLAGGLVVAAAFIGGDLRGAAEGRREVQVKWDTENAQVALRSAENAQRARDTQDRLQAAQNAERKKNAQTLSRMAANLNSATDELRKRPDRPGPAGAYDLAGPGASGWSTGARLYSSDGVFLARFADLSQRIRLQRDACYADYSRAQEALKNLKDAAAATRTQ